MKPEAIKDDLLPAAVSKAQAAVVYANEADMLNVALFGKTAKQWRNTNPGAQGNIRDQANLEQLVVLSNLESLNSVLIRQTEVMLDVRLAPAWQASPQ